MRSIFHEHRSRSRSRSPSREKIAAVDTDFVLMQRAQILEGSVQLRKQTKVSKRALDFTLGNGVAVEENSFDLEFRQTSFRKANTTSMKTLTDKEMSKAMELKRSSPNLVARLMGLDALSPVLPKLQKERGNSYQKSSVRLPKKYTAYEGYPLCTGTNEYEECKDVFEVMEMPKIEKQINEPFLKGMPSLKQSEIWKIINAQRNNSSDDEFESSKDYDGVVEDLDPNKDHFVKFFQEPNSLFRKHLQDLECYPPSPHTSHITVLKPTKTTTLGNEIYFSSERDSHKFHELLYRGKNKDHLRHTEIVVIKPSMKALNMSSLDSCHYGLRKQKRIPISRRSEVHFEMRDGHNLSDSVEAMENKTKGPRGIVREITKQLRTGGSSSSKMVSASEKYGYSSGESSRGIQGNLNLETFRGTSDHFNDYRDSLSASSYYSTESSISREARKRLSERWKMGQQNNKIGSFDRGSRTLEEMLVVDRGIPRSRRNTSNNVASEMDGRDEALGRWEDGWSRSLPRSKSLPSSSLVYENHKPSRRKHFGGSSSSFHPNEANKSPNDSLEGNVSKKKKPLVQSLNNCHNQDIFCSSREDDELSVREIHVNSEELNNMINVRHLDEEQCMISEISTRLDVNRRHESGNLAAQCKDAKFSLIFDDQKVKQFTKLAELADGGESTCTDQKGVMRKESPIDAPETLTDKEISESPSPVSSKEADQPSPISVLEQPQDKSSSETFEKISADLKELRMQLKLLKLLSANSDNVELELHISSDEDTGDCHSPHNLAQILEAFRDDEDRDFSYVLDVLIESGVHHTNGNELTSDFLVGVHVFEKLEKKYSMLVSWSRSERKLLFDLTNSILASIITPPIDQLSATSTRYCPSFARESLVEEVWQMVVKQRKEMSGKLEGNLLLEPRWLDLGDDVNMIGREIESAIIEDLIEELVLVDLFSRIHLSFRNFQVNSNPCLMIQKFLPKELSTSCKQIFCNILFT